MRLDKWVSQTSGMSRSQASAAIRKGRVSINGTVCKKAATTLSDTDPVALDGEPLLARQPRYLMMNKQVGRVCSQADDGHLSVLHDVSLPEGCDSLHFAGRLDADVSGLLLLTDDGQWSHRVTSPARRCGKRYAVTLADAPGADWAEKLEAGILLRGEQKPTLPARMDKPWQIHSGEHQGCWRFELVVYEGRYHLVKRLCAALGQPLVALHRISIGGLALDPSLAAGAWRALSASEILAATQNQDDSTGMAV